MPPFILPCQQVFPVSIVPSAPTSADEHGDLRSLFSSVVGLSQPAAPAGPLSVEAVRSKLALLPADRSVANEAPAWLADWQPEMMAQLLLLLDSPTTAARAVQLFEWLRGLPTDAPLAQLCTPGTYAAMITLYGRWRKPKSVSGEWLCSLVHLHAWTECSVGERHGAPACPGWWHAGGIWRRWCWINSPGLVLYRLPCSQALRLMKELQDRGQDSEEVHSALVEAFCR